MKNTVTVEKKIISRLKIATFVLFIFCCLMIFMLVCTKMIQKQNLNGQIYERTGEITKIDEQDGVDYITLKVDDKTTYEFNSVLGDEFDWQPYLNQTVTVIVPQQTFAWSNPWILGLKDGENVVVDYNTVLEQKRQENNEMVLVSAILTGVLAAATLAAFIWRVNITPTVESPLDKQFAEFAYDRQPTCPERKTFTIVTCVYAAFIIILGMLCSILTSTTGEDKLNTTGIVLISVFGFVAVFGAVALIILSRWAFRREIDFYADKLPFDFSDISHAHIRKSVKEELQKQIKAEREAYPHIYGDGGNGYEAEFTPDGINLYVNFDYGTEQSTDISQVFSDIPSESDPFGDGARTVNVPAVTLTYEELNLEARSFYRRKTHPMLIIVKSRLVRRDDFPEEFANDLHFLLDSNLLKTLKTFDVKVENLDYLLENKKQLMLENCYGRKPRKQKS